MFRLTGSEMIAKLLKIEVLEVDDDELAYDGTPENEQKQLADGRPAWMRTLFSSVSTWLNLVPKVSRGILYKCSFDYMERNSSSPFSVNFILFLSFNMHELNVTN